MLWACAPGTPTSERASRFQVTVGRTRVFVCCGTLTAASAKQATSLAAHNGHANYPRAATARRQVTCARARTHTPARCALPACLRWFCRTVPTGSPPSVARAGSMARRTITPCSPHASDLQDCRLFSIRMQTHQRRQEPAILRAFSRPCCACDHAGACGCLDC